MIVVVNIILSIGIFLGGCQLIKVLDSKFRVAFGKNKAVMVFTIVGLVTAVCIGGNENLSNSFFWSSLMLAAYCDYCTTEIYDFVYTPALIAGVSTLFLKHVSQTHVVLTELIIFILLQLLLFRHFYGFSDCIAFSVCAIWMASSGGELYEYFILMTIAYMLLILVQACKRNIDKKGRLKKPIAMIPYIVVAMLVTQVLVQKRWEISLM